MGDDHLQNLPDLELPPAVGKEDFPVFIPRPFVPQAHPVRVD